MTDTNQYQQNGGQAEPRRQGLEFPNQDKNNWNGLPYQSNLKSGTRLASVLHPTKDDAYIVYQSTDGKIKVTRHTNGKLVSTETAIYTGRCLNRTPLATCHWHNERGLYFHVFYVTADYKLANVIWTEWNESCSFGDLEKENIKVFGDSDIAAIAWDRGSKIRVWYQSPHSQGEGIHYIKQIHHEGGRWSHGSLGYTFDPLPGTHLAVSNVGTDDHPRLNLFAQAKNGAIIRGVCDPGAKEWSDQSDYILHSGGVLPGTPLSSFGFYNPDFQLVNMFYLNDQHEIVEWRCAHNTRSGGKVTKCHHTLPHFVNPTTDLAVCGVQQLKELNNIQQRLYMVGPAHALHSLTYFADDEQNGGWQDTQGEGYMGQWWGVIDIGDTSVYQQREAVFEPQRPIPTITNRRVRCDKTEDRYYCYDPAQGRPWYR